MLRAVVQPPATKAIVVYVVHAPLARFVRWGDVPVGVDFNARERAVAAIRARIDVDLADGTSVIVMGDLNTTERELGYAALSPGLRDSHLDAGTGPGFTWRPWPVAALPLGLVRIDYVLTTPDLSPTASTVNCGVPSDHCRVDATLTVTGPLTPG
jgi:endonuclease/exonuclease/phosphatase family metal-dependent hydrolase